MGSWRSTSALMQLSVVGEKQLLESLFAHGVLCIAISKRIPGGTTARSPAPGALEPVGLRLDRLAVF